MKLNDYFKDRDNIDVIKKWSEQYNKSIERWGDEKYPPSLDHDIERWGDEKYSPPLDNDIEDKIKKLIEEEIDPIKEITTHCKIIEVDGKFLLEFPDGNRIEINLEDPESIGLAITSEIAKKLLKNV